IDAKPSRRSTVASVSFHEEAGIRSHRASTSMSAALTLSGAVRKASIRLRARSLPSRCDNDAVLVVIRSRNSEHVGDFGFLVWDISFSFMSFNMTRKIKLRHGT